MAWKKGYIGHNNNKDNQERRERNKTLMMKNDGSWVSKG